MKRIIQMSLMLCVCFLHLNAQTATEDMPKPKKNSIYLEGGGNGIAYSLNYDHLFSMKNNPKMGIGTRIGYSHGTYPWLFGMESTVAILPVEIFFSYGIKSCLELGLGYTFVFKENNREGMIAFRSSYKYRGPKGFIFGVGVLARTDYWGILFPIPHLSIGFSF
jgi:hypothetical protein